MGSKGLAAVSDEWSRLSSCQSTESWIKPHTCHWSAHWCSKEAEEKVDGVWRLKFDQSVLSDGCRSVHQPTPSFLDALIHTHPDLSKLNKSSKKKKVSLFL